MSFPEIDWNAAGLGGVAVGLMIAISKFVVQPSLKLLRPKTVNDMAAISADVRGMREEMQQHRQESREMNEALHSRITNLAERVSFIEGQHSKERKG